MTSETPQPVAAPPPHALPSTLEEVDRAIAANELEDAEGGLLQLTKSTDPEIGRRAVAILGLVYQRQARYVEARDALARAIATNPAIAPFLQLRLVEVERDAAGLDAAIALDLQIIESPSSPAAAEVARIMLPALYAAAARRAEAEQALTDLDSLPIDTLNESHFVATAGAFEQEGWNDLADRLRLRVLSQFPQGKHTERVYGLLTLRDDSPLLQLDFEASLTLADRFGRVNRYDQALDFLQRIAKRFPGRSGDPRYRYERVTSLFNSRRYDEVIAEPAVRGEPYYLATEMLRARALWRRQRNAEFVAMINEIIRKHPSSEEARAGKLLLGKYYVTDETDYARALQNLREAIAAGLVGNDGETVWTLGWTQLLAGLDQEALDTFARYVQQYPDADYTSNALFWTGKTHEKRGETEKRDASFQKLITMYPYSYYSARARAISGMPDNLLMPAGEPRQFPDVSTAADPQTAAVLTSVRELVAVGLADDAARQIRTEIGSRTGDPALAFNLADLYSRAGQPLQAMGTLQRTFREFVRHGGANVPQRFWEILYPRPYWNAVQESAARSGVEPLLIAAIIRQESAFDPNVVSNAGAVGLMQIMPDEAARIATAAGLGAITREQLFDPKTNIAVGAAEIRQKIDAMDGKQILGIASYNAGEAAVGRWIAKTALDDDVDVFVESIPYAETRLYVKNVTRNLFEYRRIYGSP